mgnify:CR=1 FL=1
MQLKKHPSGYFTSNVNSTEILLYLNEELLPSDSSLEKLDYMAKKFDIYKRIIGLPDLHFKDKNFVPSGMTIPLKKYFSPMLLGPNNDGMGSLKFRVASNSLNDESIDKIFIELKNRIQMFRRKKDIIKESTLRNIFHNGISDLITEWGFDRKDLLKFEDDGCAFNFNLDEDVKSFFPKDRPSNLPDFIPGHEIYERGGKCIGVLDGTSHFIELFKVDKKINQQQSKALGITENDYFFLIHAGAGDICITSHRAYLGENNNKYYTESEIGNRALKSFFVSANYGFANRLYIYKTIKNVIEETLSDLENVDIFSDIPHDYLEAYEDQKLFIHRKGAAKLFPSNYFTKDHIWSKTGTPYLFPSCVGGDAFIITNKDGNKNTFNTVSHGAGRLIRKERAINLYKNNNFNNNLKHKIKLFRYGVDQIEGQNPLAFKDIDLIIKTFQKFNLADPIIKLKPLASLKA